MKKDRKNVINTGDKPSLVEILVDHKKMVMPAILIVAVIATVLIAIDANKKTAEMVSSPVTAESTSAYSIPDAAMELNAHDDVNELIKKYYDACVSGDSDTISSIYHGLEASELLKAVEVSSYIDSFSTINIYTKPGPEEGSYIAYVETGVMLTGYDKEVPGMDTFYICKDEAGSLYINGDIVDESIQEYIKAVTLQSDVVDLNNKVATAYNEMVASDPELSKLLTNMRTGLQVSVGEALAVNQSSAIEASVQESGAEGEASTDAASIEEQAPQSVTLRAIDVVKIRSSDSTEADVLGRTSIGDEFEQLEERSNGWSKVMFEGKEAFVKTEFFEKVVNGESQETQTQETAEDATSAASEESKETTESTTTAATDIKGTMRTTDSIRMRESESTESEILTTIYKGEKVEVVESYANGWAKIKYNKKTGYVKTEFLEK